MHDPGCHWFYLGGGPNHRKYVTAVTRPGAPKIDKVGARLTLTAKGTYHITMVKQMPDDKTLTLKVT